MIFAPRARDSDDLSLSSKPVVNIRRMGDIMVVTCKLKGCNHFSTMHTGYGRAVSLAEGFQNSKF